jgi:hypothetical protein
MSKPTKDMVEKAIKEWQENRQVCVLRTSQICPHCLAVHNGKWNICPACQLDQALADYEIAGDRLKEQYFKVISDKGGGKIPNVQNKRKVEK